MHKLKSLLMVLVPLFAQACGHARLPAPPATSRSSPVEHLSTRGPYLLDSAAKDGERHLCSSLQARIWALIARGEFAQAEVLIAESTAAGAVSQQTAARMLEKIALLNTKLSSIPASLQRAPDFPSQLKDFTLFQLRNMLHAEDYTLATHTQLRMAVKLIEQQTRLMAD